MNALRIVIIEDEPASARNLKYYLEQLEPSGSVLATLDSVESSASWLREQAGEYDLIFMDIRLNDGISFEIFNRVSIDKPVVFVTAYDEYALKAFKANGIDYILKPFDVNELQHALHKFRRLSSPVSSQENIAQLMQAMDTVKAGVSGYKQSFLIHFRNKLVPLATADVAWFYTANEIVFANTFDGQKHMIDFTLEQLQQQLDPFIFFRANRQFIVQRKSIREVEFYFNGRLALTIQPAASEKVLISKARVPEFKLWMNS